MNSIPLWVRRAFIDAIESSVAAIGALSIIVPNSLTEAKAQALIIGIAIMAATVAAFRRAVLSHGLDWVREKLLGDGGQ